jgi:hypothetical protein
LWHQQEIPHDLSHEILHAFESIIKLICQFFRPYYYKYFFPSFGVRLRKTHFMKGTQMAHECESIRDDESVRHFLII